MLMIKKTTKDDNINMDNVFGTTVHVGSNDIMMNQYPTPSILALIKNDDEY